MFELFKIVWDIVVLRDAAQKGQLNWRIWPTAFAIVFVEYAIGLSAVLLYEKHPEYKSFFVTAMIFMGISFVGFMWWAWRWQSRLVAARKAKLQLVTRSNGN